MDLQRSLRTPRRPWIAALSLCSVAVLAAGCGAGSEGASVTPQDASSSSAATDLNIKIVDGETSTYSLTCDPVGGDHPDAEAACAALAKSGDQALPEPAKDLICTQIFGGDQTAAITGTWQGKSVDATFSRKNGCEISRWDALTPLLPKVATARAQ